MKVLFTMNIPSFKAVTFLLILTCIGLFNTNSSAQLPNDVGIINVVSPAAQCGLEIEEIEVTLFNFGTVPQSLIPFSFSVNGQLGGVMQPTDGFYTGVLGPDSMVTIAFEATFDFSSAGIYSLSAWTELETDMDISNDTFNFEVESILTTIEGSYLNNFNLSQSDWYVSNQSENSTFEYGTPNGTDITSAATGDFAWVTRLDSTYDNNELSYLLSPCMDFSSFSGDPVFGCSIYYDTELNWDGAWLEGSIDGGASWNKIGDIASGTNWYNFTNNNEDLGDVWAGNSQGWLNAETFLIGFGGEPDVRFRFIFDSDASSNNYDGIGIDDIFIFVPFTDDLGATAVTNLSTNICGDEMDQLVMNIRNYGTDPQTGFDVSYQIDNNPVVTENVGALVVPPGEVVPYTFSSTFSTAVFNTVYSITTWTSLSGELNILNDTSVNTLSTLFPDILPIVTDFEEMVTPDGWFNSDLIGDGHNNVSFVAYDNLYSADPEFELRSPVIGPINAGDSLTFDYRYTDYFPGTTATILGDGDVLELAISTDCGENYNIVYTIDQNNHIPIVEMTNVLIDLDAYAGEYIQIRFQAAWGNGDYWLDLDNINIIGCPVDLAISSLISSVSSSGASDGVAMVLPAQGMGPYTYSWSNGSSISSIDGVEAGIYTVTVTDANGCIDVMDIEVGTCPESFDLTATTTDASGETVADGTINLSLGGGSAPYSISWSNGEMGSSLSGLTPGDYSVTVIDAFGCSDELTVTVGTMVATNNIDLVNQIRVMPNPTHGQTILDMSFPSRVNFTAKVINTVGKTLIQLSEVETSGGQYPIDLGNLPAGIYFIQITVNGNINHVERVIRI